MNKKTKITVSIIIVLLLASSFFWGGNAHTESVPARDEVNQEIHEYIPAQEQDAPAPSSQYGEDDKSSPSEAPAGPETKTESGPAPEAADIPETTDIPEATDVPEEKHCTVSISCKTILNNMDMCAPEKQSLVPASAWILKSTEVSFEEGESVFDLLLRTCKENSIHMEYENTPIYNSAYIEGIHNLYEFDCGPLSGWMYSVNDWYPHYGSSRYELKAGDVICWRYTCDLGADIGGGSLDGFQKDD